MKKLIPVFLIFAALGTQAQSVTLSKNPEHRSKILEQAQKTSRAEHKTTAVYHRIKATAGYAMDETTFTISLVDSAFYQYSNARGSFINYTEPQVSDYGLESDISYDTATKYGDFGSGTISAYSQYTATYDNANKRISFVDAYASSGTSFDNNSEQKAIYNANGDIATVTHSLWNTTLNKWATTAITEYKYDGQNRLTVDSTHTVMPTDTTREVTYFHYDANGNLDTQVRLSWNGTMLDSAERMIYTYYPNNTLKTSVEQEYTFMWENVYFDSLGYTVAGEINYRVYREWDDIAGVWENFELETRTYSNGKLQAVYVSEWDDTKWEKLYDFELQYDSRGNISRLDVYAYINGVKVPIPAFTQYIYYEEYYDVSVKDAPVSAKLIVYPNPATNNVNVVLNGMKDATIQLTNISGQVVRTLSASSQATVSVNLTGLQAGNYILTVSSNNGAPARQMITVQ